MTTTDRERGLTIHTIRSTVSSSSPPTSTSSTRTRTSTVTSLPHNIIMFGLFSYGKDGWLWILIFMGGHSWCCDFCWRCMMTTVPSIGIGVGIPSIISSSSSSSLGNNMMIGMFSYRQDGWLRRR